MLVLGLGKGLGKKIGSPLLGKRGSSRLTRPRLQTLWLRLRTLLGSIRETP